MAVYFQAWSSCHFLLVPVICKLILPHILSSYNQLVYNLSILEKINFKEYSAFDQGRKNGMKRVNTSVIMIFKKAKTSPATLFKKKLQRRCFLLNFAKFLRTRFLIGHLRWLLLQTTI